MSNLGVHFALLQAEADTLRSLPNDSARLDHLQAVIELTYFENQPDLKAESDRAWDAMHRALADGQLTWDGGEYPLNHVVLAGESLYKDNDYIISLKTPRQVQDVAAVLPSVTEAEFRRRYLAIDATCNGFPISDEDFSYTWDWFQGVRDLYIRAAKEGRFVLFTADQ